METKNHPYTKVRVIILTGLLTFIAGSLYAQQRIEGLSYIDGEPISVEFEDGKITAVWEIEKLSDKGKELYIAPGLIDSQVNGFQGVSFSFGGGGDLTLEGIQKATEALWENGVTTYLPTLTTNSYDLLVKNFAILADARHDASLMGSIPGFHLEGPYISPDDGYRGAHSKQFVRKPDWEEFMKFYRASEEGIITVTIAPETEGAQEFIKKCTEKGIITALGHHNGTTEQIDMAVENGARISTHLGNGCANSINRHVNPLWPQLSNDGLMISIICDGFHLKPEEIRVFYKVKGPEKTIIVSDVTSYAGLSPGIYKNIDGDDIELTQYGKIQYPAQKVLAGSASSINKGVGHIMKVTGCTLEESIRMASTNPAGLYGLTDRGKIEAGKRADLILFTMDDFTLKVKKTIVAGNIVYELIE